LARSAGRFARLRSLSIRQAVAVSTAARLEPFGRRYALWQGRAGPAAAAGPGSASARTARAVGMRTGRRVQASLQKPQTGAPLHAGSARGGPHAPVSRSSGHARRCPCAGGSRRARACATIWVPLGSRPMAGHQVLVLRIGVRIPAPQLPAESGRAPLERAPSPERGAPGRASQSLSRASQRMCSAG
jgi:hypothetical protein